MIECMRKEVDKMNKLNINYWSDYACPFCYIGKSNLEAAIKELGLENQVEMQMLSFELDPSAPKEYMGEATDLLAQKYGISREQASEQIKRVEDMGKEAGIVLDYANALYTSTFDSHRLTKLAQEKLPLHQANQFIARVFKAMFEDHTMMSDLETLKRIALEYGLSEEDIDTVIKTDAYAKDVRLEENLASQYNVTAVPYFIFANKYAVPGALPKDQMKEVLTKIMAEENIVVEGASCGIDGCQ